MVIWLLFVVMSCRVEGDMNVEKEVLVFRESRSHRPRGSVRHQEVSVHGPGVTVPKRMRRTCCHASIPGALGGGWYVQ